VDERRRIVGFKPNGDISGARRQGRGSQLETDPNYTVRALRAEIRARLAAPSPTERPAACLQRGVCVLAHGVVGAILLGVTLVGASVYGAMLREDADAKRLGSPAGSVASPSIGDRPRSALMALTDMALPSSVAAPSAGATVEIPDEQAADVPETTADAGCGRVDIHGDPIPAKSWLCGTHVIHAPPPQEYEAPREAVRLLNRRAEDGSLLSIQGQGVNCSSYSSQAAAQAAYRANPIGLRNLDGDGDGVACESNRAPFDREPVRNVQVPATTGSTAATAPATVPAAAPGAEDGDLLWGRG
jgi:hypothetical protein